MPPYVVIATHEPSFCPGSHGKVRRVWKDIQAAVPAALQKHGIKHTFGPVLLAGAHKIIVGLEAPNADAILDFGHETRLDQIQVTELYRATPLDKVFAEAERNLPSLF